MKLNQKKTAPLLKEWSDVLLFASYKTLVVSTEKENVKKGVGGARVIRTTHHPCWDAKNRHGLPEEISLLPEHTKALPDELKAIFPKVEATPPPEEPKAAPEPQPQPTPQSQPEPQATPKNGIPAQLLQLMETNNVTELEIRKAVAARGYYPEETPITNYEDQFVNGVLVGAWNKVYNAIQKMKGDE
jgi:hypothetical protein